MQAIKNWCKYLARRTYEENNRGEDYFGRREVSVLELNKIMILVPKSVI